MSLIKQYLYLIFICCLVTISAMIFSIPFAYYVFNVQFVTITFLGFTIPYYILFVVSLIGLGWSLKELVVIINNI